MPISSPLPVDHTLQPALPNDLGSGVALDAASAPHIGEELAGTYCFAELYPHIALDAFLPEEVARFTSSTAIYDEMPNVSTIYHARPGDAKVVHRAVRPLRVEQHIRPWVPPVLQRSAPRVFRRLTSS